jgi:malto-oligosyltrehalose trehalohydrolase
LENDNNAARYLAPEKKLYNAQWNDDLHHAMHVLATGESGGYYADYADAPRKHLARCLAEGFAYQGDPSPYRDGERRGEPSADIAPTSFVSFLQNHDQIGNRAFGERVAALAPEARRRALYAIFLLAPAVPMFFMGEEWGTERPFPFFCDFGPELARAVTEGRRKEFARFPQFGDPAARRRIPDPNDPATFSGAILDWANVDSPSAKPWLDFHRELLRIRRTEIVPRLKTIASRATYTLLGDQGVRVQWRWAERGALHLAANVSDAALAIDEPPGRIVYPNDGGRVPGQMAPWSVLWSIE